VSEANPLLAAARELYPSIDARAAKAGNDPVPAETIEALRRAGLFGAMTPRALGGAELALVDAIDVFAEVARADGSTGWCLMAGASAVAYFGAYASDEFAARSSRTACRWWREFAPTAPASPRPAATA
jgi:alkylation response protein AidB-like acyl-CoA dehydrogenase